MWPAVPLLSSKESFHAPHPLLLLLLFLPRKEAYPMLREFLSRIEPNGLEMDDFEPLPHPPKRLSCPY